MNIEGIIWLEAIVEKLVAKHRVTTVEVEETLANPAKFRFIEKGDREGENAYMALGQTNAGRYLAVLFIYKSTREAL